MSYHTPDPWGDGDALRALEKAAGVAVILFAALIVAWWGTL